MEIRGAGCAILAGLAVWAAPVSAQQVASADMSGLSIEQLAKVEIISVSKAAEPLSEAAGAVYVISHDDVVRSGANSIPELLRLAPNLEVMQSSASGYQITARGFNGNNAAQNFTDKLLVLIDGRSVYTPLYSGVYWDMQDVPPENIERIEVVSGPGGTLWGANAVNGVINIITRKAADTAGGLIDLGAGDQEASATLQYGGKLGDSVDYRVYARDFYRQALDLPGGASAGDGWGKPQGGFRLDWNPDADQLTLSGDIYRGAEAQPGASNQSISGANLTAHWLHPLDDGSSVQLLTYFDQTSRWAVDGGGLTLNTYDIELQHSFALGGWNTIVWGAGERIDQYRITDRIATDNSLIWQPPARTLNLANIFAEDRIPLGEKVQLSIGLKLENDPYSGISAMPSGRLSWKVGEGDLVWAAISRAVRSPSPFDTDVVEKLGTTTFLTGNPDFRPEQVTAYEIGYRGQFSSVVSFSVSLFENVYDDLKTIEITPVNFLPLMWGNGMRGNVHGLEAWGSWQAADWWRLSAGFNVQHEDLEFAPGASGLLGVAQAGDDPRHQASLRSSMALSDDVSFDADLRDIGALPDPKVPEYVELNARLGWRVSDTLELSVSGFNLLHAHHLEYVTGAGDLVKRNFFVETKWRF